MGKLKILLADDHEIFLDGLAALLKPYNELKIIGCATDGDEVLRKLKEGPSPHLVIMDINMPTVNGIEATAMIKSSYPSVKVLILSSHNRYEFIRKLKEMGADGYVLKNAGLKELVRACNTIAGGGTHFSREVMKAAPLPNPRASSRATQLTAREKQIIAMIARGMSSKQITQTLNITAHTVNTHRKNILSKLKLNNPAEITIYALKSGIIDGFDIH